MQFLKNHWFGFLVSMFTLYFLNVLLIVMLSPHQDEEKRGFVKCTEEMAGRMHDCNSQNICVLKAVITNTFCDIEVINQGLVSWFKGEQARPWSNYMFAPVFKTDADTREDYELGTEMSELDIRRQELEAMAAGAPSVVFVSGVEEEIEDEE